RGPSRSWQPPLSTAARGFIKNAVRLEIAINHHTGASCRAQVNLAGRAQQHPGKRVAARVTIRDLDLKARLSTDLEIPGRLQRLVLELQADRGRSVGKRGRRVEL